MGSGIGLAIMKAIIEDTMERSHPFKTNRREQFFESVSVYSCEHLCLIRLCSHRYKAIHHEVLLVKTFSFTY
jgi:hypothetical protein